jgi:hypothetical protein
MRSATLLILYLTPLALLVWFCARFSVNVPVHDQWRLVPLFEKIADGTACFLDFWALHSNHRIVFPKILFSAMAFGTHWNISCELAVSILFAIATFLLLFRLSVNKDRAPQDPAFHFTNILCSFFVFSLVQHENWLWGFQAAWLLVNACVVMAIFALRLDGNASGSPLTRASTERAPGNSQTESAQISWSDPRLALAASCCALASFSSAQGVLSWLALVPSVIALGGKASHIRQRLTLWAFLFTATLALYSIDYHPKRNAGLTMPWEKPAVSATYFLNVLGSPLTRSPAFTSFFGLGMLSLFLLFFSDSIRRRGTDRTAAPWLSLGLFSILSAASITVGRAHFGVLHALDSSRYTTISILLIVAVLQLALMSTGRDRSGKPWAWSTHLHHLVTVVLIGALGAQSYWAIAKAHEALVYRQGAKDGLELIRYLDGRFFHESPDSCLGIMTRKTELVRSGAEALDRLGFRRIATDIAFVDNPPDVYGGLEAPAHAGESVRLSTGDHLRLTGWATLPRQQEPPHLVLLSHGSKRSFFASAFLNPASPTLPTPFDPERHSPRRWSLTLPAKYLPAGESRIEAWVYDATQRQFLKMDGVAVVTVEEE